MRALHQVTFRNNSGNKPKDVLISEFVVRLPEFENMMDGIRKSTDLGSALNYLVIGQRGYGKTTLLHRVKYKIEEEECLKRVLPVMLSEEQYSICSLTDLWEKVIEYCADWHSWSYESSALKKLFNQDNGSVNHEEELRKIILRKLNLSDTRILLFIENYDSFIRKIGNERAVLHGVLSSSKEINIIASSTSFGDHNLNFSSPEFGYLKKIVLKGLSTKECIKLLLSIGNNTGYEAEIKSILTEHKNRVESLRRLTGGVPRTISYMFDIFLDNKGGRAMKDLYQLLDTLTLLYKAEIDQLSPQQQKVIDVIAKNWDAIAVKEISKLTRLESKNISSILVHLEKNALVEKINTKTKNNLYRVKERFLNIWYLMRFGRKAEQENVKWLVRFFDVWCDESELAKRISEHIADLQLGEYDATAAIDMGNTFLSCRKAPAHLKYQLYKETKNILPEKLGKNVRISNKDLYDQITNLIESNKPTEALEILELIEVKDARFFMSSVWVYLQLKQYENAVESAKALYTPEEKNIHADVILGIIYESFIKDYANAEKYFQQGHSLGHPLASWRLGYISYYVKNDYKTAVQYLKHAIRKNFKVAYETLYEIFVSEGDLKSAEQTALKAVDVGRKDAYILLGKVYDRLGEHTQAETSYQKAIEVGNWKAAIHLAKLILFKTGNKDIPRVTKLLQDAIANGIKEGYQTLGYVYEKYKEDESNAERTWQEGVAAGDAGSAHRLGHFYSKRNNYDQSDKMFKQAVEMGDYSAFMCYAEDIYSNGRKEKLNSVLAEFDNYGMNANRLQPLGRLLQARLLLWNNDIDQSITIFKSTYDQISKAVDGKETDEQEDFLSEISGQISHYLILLLAKEHYKLCHSLFEEQIDHGIDLKSIAKPVYYVLMEKLKQEFPIEYLKAGPELADTMDEINQKINNLKNQL